MSYRRNKTRPPRAVEESDAMVEVLALQAEVARLHNLLQAALEQLETSEWLRDALQRDVGKLAVELRHERNKVSFLCGFNGPGHEPWDIRRLF